MDNRPVPVVKPTILGHCYDTVTVVVEHLLTSRFCYVLPVCVPGVCVPVQGVGSSPGAGPASVARPPGTRPAPGGMGV